jgi:esterase/lipase superfamily enzyme
VGQSEPLLKPRIPAPASAVSQWSGVAASIGLACLLGACATTTPLMPTPTLYSGEDATPIFTQARADQQKPSVDLFYVTDRMPRTAPDEPEPYSAERSRALAFGAVSVDIGESITWDQLVAQSKSGERKALDLKLGSVQELGRFPAVVYDLIKGPQGVTRDPAVVDRHEKAAALLKQELARRVAASPRKEVVLFVHGYHDTFSDAAFSMADLCHFLGREFVCAIFSWPAGGRRGILMGYNEDRESGEYAVEHLKKTIRMIADTPGVERIHLLAHSRGTDVLVSALMMLNVEAYVARNTFSDRFKVANVVLMAPDLDFDVAAAKIFSVVSDPDLPHGSAPEPHAVVPIPAMRITVYVSPNDKALTVSQYLFGSFIRLGRLQAAELGPERIERARKAAIFDSVSVSATTDMFGHSYFTSNPEVSSDIIALIRYGAKPGDPQRPLIEVARPFWRVRTAADSGP